MASEQRKVAFLMWPGSHPAAMMAGLSVLRSANRMAGFECYTAQCLTLDDEPILSEEGWLLPARRWSEDMEFDQFWVVADLLSPPESLAPSIILRWREMLRENVALGAIEGGVFPLALAGLMDEHRCAVHWRVIDEFRERFPHVQATTQLFEQDSGRLSSSGGQATADLFMALVAEEHGAELAALVAEDLVVERIRDGSERQRVPLRNRLGSTHPKLTQAVILMESNIEEPLTTEIPTNVELAIAETEPGLKGDTATGATKPAVLESGATVQVPLFVNEGDVIRVNTETGDYVTRVTTA